jgi:hypothetical protein
MMFVAYILLYLVAIKIYVKAMQDRSILVPVYLKFSTIMILYAMVPTPTAIGTSYAKY